MDKREKQSILRFVIVISIVGLLFMSVAESMDESYLTDWVKYTIAALMVIVIFVAGWIIMTWGDDGDT